MAGTAEGAVQILLLFAKLLKVKEVDMLFSIRLEKFFYKAMVRAA